MNPQKLHVEDERGTARDGPAALVAVAELTGDGELGALAQGHAGDAPLPARDDLLAAQGEGEGRPSRMKW